MGTAAAIARGDKITTKDCKQIWLDKTAIGMQLRVAAMVEEYESGWPGWDYEEIALAELVVPEKSYKDKLRNVLQSANVYVVALFGYCFLSDPHLFTFYYNKQYDGVNVDMFHHSKKS